MRFTGEPARAVDVSVSVMVSPVVMFPPIVAVLTKASVRTLERMIVSVAVPEAEAAEILADQTGVGFSEDGTNKFTAAPEADAEMPAAVKVALPKTRDAS